MGKISDNRQLLNLYLKSRNFDYVKEIMKNSYGIIYSTVKNTLRKNNIDEEKCDEYFSVAYIAVADKIKSLDSYDGLDFNFYNFIIMHTSRTVINEIKKETKRKEKEFSIDELNDKNIIDIGLVDTSIDFIDKKIDAQLMKKIIFCSDAKLSEHQKDYICLFYGLDYEEPLSMMEIAKLRGVTRQNVQLGINCGLRKIRAYIAKNEHENKILRIMNGENVTKRKS